MVRLIGLTRLAFLSVVSVVALLSIGCCGPMGYGPGCGDYACNDCDGTACQPIPYGPLDGVRNFKRSLVCGGGCGESYIGEWISTPPDACDPCCGDEFVGGATACRPFCWQPGSLLGGLGANLYGSRFCSDAEASVPCGCGDICDGGCDGGYIDGGYIDDSYIGGGCSSGSCGGGGCSTCSSGKSGTSQMARRVTSPMSGRNTRTAAAQSHRMDARVNRIRR